MKDSRIENAWFHNPLIMLRSLIVVPKTVRGPGAFEGGDDAASVLCDGPGFGRDRAPFVFSVCTLSGRPRQEGGVVLWLRGEFRKESQRCFQVEPGAGAEGAGQVAEVIAGRRLAVQLAKPFSFAEAVELDRDDRSGVLVGRAGELGVELQGGGAFGVPEASGDGVQVGACREELGGGVVPEFLQRAGDADPTGVSAVSVGHGVGVPWRSACGVGGERVSIVRHGDTIAGRFGAASLEPFAEQLTGEQVQRQSAAVARLRRFLDALSFLTM